MADQQSGLTAGQVVLGRYVVERLIGSGGMGQVYRARHHRLEHPVALKVLHSAGDLRKLARFEREARVMARVRHPNVVSVLDYGQLDAATPCIAMELVEGETLGQRLGADRVLPWRDATRILVDVLRGLAAIHAVGVLHRDLKPDNILLVPGDPEVVKLIDFGIALAQEDDRALTQTGFVIGTPDFMSPEQYTAAKVDVRSDLYTAGLILYRMLDGAVPFGRLTKTPWLTRLRRDVPPLSPVPGRETIPPALGRVVRDMLAIEPASRPRDAKECLGRLRDAIRRGEEEAERPAATAVPPAPAMPRAVIATGSLPEEPSRSGVAADPRRESQVLVAARLPPSRLARPEERRWLAQLSGPSGRGYTLGNHAWFSVQAAGSAERSQAEAERIVEALTRRYRELGRAAWRPLTADFRMTAASLTGAESLPAELVELLDELERQGG